MLLFVASAPLYGQNSITIKMVDHASKEPLTGASAIVKGSSNGAIANADGILTITDLPDGPLTIVGSFVGYKPKQKELVLPLADGTACIVVELEEEAHEVQEVAISATRSTRSIQDAPTRVEFVGREELEEKSIMRPGDIRVLLSESTGIQTQQTSAISGNSLIKIQGLDGRYTQILKDGLPAFPGAASGLGLLQTPPLDLQQVEIIKGSSSTLYGGGAIAGLVNLVTKVPQKERDLQIQLNGTTAKGLDANLFYGQRSQKIGTTIFTSYNRNRAYDPSETGFTAIPQYDRITFSPTLFAFIDPRNSLRIGLETMHEKRIGGDMTYLKHGKTGEHSYYEQNRSQRYAAKLMYQHTIGENSQIDFKSNLTYNCRKIEIPNYQFDGDQWTSFSEATYRHTGERTEWIAGLNLSTESFNEKTLHSVPPRDYTLNTLGAFVQNTTNITPRLILETGLRGDYIRHHGLVLLPRLSALCKISPKWSTRIGGGFGYKPPTIFTEESERLQFENVMPIDQNASELEKSYGANIDFNYRTALGSGKTILTVNQLFFYTHLRNPLDLRYEPNSDTYRFYNIHGHIGSKGSETNLKIKYDDLSLYLGYTFTDVKFSHDGISRPKTLTPKHRINAVLMYEIEDSWKVGYECYYVGRQTLTDGLVGKDYVTMGIMVQKIWEKISIYANFENFTDCRQTRFDTIYTGTVAHPQFRDIYAPLDGFVANAGVILKL